MHMFSYFYGSLYGSIGDLNVWAKTQTSQMTSRKLLQGLLQAR